MIFRVHEKTNPASSVKNFNELPHCRNQQGFANTLPLIFPGDGQPAKPYPGHLTRQLLAFFRWKGLRLYLAKIEGEKAQNGLWLGSAILNQNECS